MAISSADLKIRLFRAVVAQCLFAFFLLLLCVQIISFGVTLWRSSSRMVEKMASIHLVVPQQHLQDELKLHWPLFGEYIPKQFKDINVKHSTLNLQVVGILYSIQAEDSQVILRTANGEERSYKIGDNLPGGAVLRQITSDGVLVLNRGELESLSLPKNKLIFEPPSKRLFP